MLYHLSVPLKHLSAGNFLKYPGLFPDCKIIQVLSPPCLPLFLGLFQLYGHLYLAACKSSREAEIKSFCAASLQHVLWWTKLVLSGKMRSLSYRFPLVLEVVSLFSLLKMSRSLLPFPKQKYNPSAKLQHSMQMTLQKELKLISTFLFTRVI